MLSLYYINYLYNNLDTFKKFNGFFTFASLNSLRIKLTKNLNLRLGNTKKKKDKIINFLLFYLHCSYCK